MLAVVAKRETSSHGNNRMKMWRVEGQNIGGESRNVIIFKTKAEAGTYLRKWRKKNPDLPTSYPVKIEIKNRNDMASLLKSVTH
jgi:hypothetical protein